MASNYIKVGKIVNTIGLKGEVKIYLHTDFPEKRFIKGNKIFIGSLDTPNEISVEVESAKPSKNLYVLKFKEFDNINNVEKYKDKFLWINKEDQGELDDGEFYYHQIIGCTVLTTNNKELGKITEILSTSANDVWVVKPLIDKKDILIPYIESIVKEVNVHAKKITIEEIDGLIS